MNFVLMEVNCYLPVSETALWNACVGSALNSQSVIRRVFM